MKIIECVPNFSEGRDKNKIDEITNTIKSVESISLLDVDMGFDTNRTVVTFVGPPQSVLEAAFAAIKKASELIDMRLHKGEHSRMGATDVCPFIPVSNVSMSECINVSKALAKQVAKELEIPIFLYEKSASHPNRVNLANIRSGEYEGMEDKLNDENWFPDYGTRKVNKKAGVTAIGAREFLIAYNINLNTHNKKLASDIALDIREAGRGKRDANGKFVRDDNGNIVKVPGSLKSTKAVGWYIDEYKQAQVSMNLTNYNITSIHQAFDEVCKQALRRGLRVTGSEIVGLIPLKAIKESGIYYLDKQNQSKGIPEDDIIHIAIKSLGLDDLSIFNPNEKIIEYRINKTSDLLVNHSVESFLYELSRQSPAPGGGSVSALAGSLAAALTSMVGNLTYDKKGHEKDRDSMILLSDKSQKLLRKLNKYIDEDTNSFNGVIQALRMPKSNQEEIKTRYNAVQDATKLATQSPFKILKACAEIMPLAKDAIEKGNPNSISDAGVAAEMAHSGAQGAAMNVLINLKDIDEEEYCDKMKNDIQNVLLSINEQLQMIRNIAISKLV